GGERALAARRPAGGVVRELTAGLDEARHPCELRLTELVGEHRLPEDATLPRVLERGLERGLHQSDGARRRLQTSVLEALHLEVEALTAAAFAADEMLGGNAPVVERDLVRVHAAIAERVDRPAFHR